MSSSSESATDFYFLTSGLNIEETKYLYQLLKMYRVGEIPLENYHHGILIGRVIDCVNRFDSKQTKSFLVFLEGAVSGIEKHQDSSSHSTDIFFIGGQNTINSGITSQSNTITSEALVSIDSSAVALAIEKGLVGKEEIQEILQSIGNRLNKSEVSSKNNIENN